MVKRWSGGDRLTITPWGPVYVKSGGEFRPLRRVVNRTAKPGMVILTLDCGHEVHRNGSPRRARCEHCWKPPVGVPSGLYGNGAPSKGDPFTPIP